MTVLRAHFDGKVIVPEEPVDLPTGKSLEIHVRELEQPLGDHKEFPTFPVKPGAKTITTEDIKRAEDEI